MKTNYIGKITNTFGIKGELKVYSESDFIDFRFRKGAKLILKNSKTTEIVNVSSSRVHKGYVLITINDINDINEVIKYIGFDIYSDEEVILNENEFYVDNLIDLDVFNQDNEFLGKVSEVISIPSSDILEITNGKEKFLIPFVDEYIIEISDKIIIKEIEGMR